MEVQRWVRKGVPLSRSWVSALSYVKVCFGLIQRVFAKGRLRVREEHATVCFSKTSNLQESERKVQGKVQRAQSHHLNSARSLCAAVYQDLESLHALFLFRNLIVIKVNALGFTVTKSTRTHALSNAHACTHTHTHTHTHTFHTDVWPLWKKMLFLSHHSLRSDMCANSVQTCSRDVS